MLFAHPPSSINARVALGSMISIKDHFAPVIEASVADLRYPS